MVEWEPNRDQDPHPSVPEPPPLRLGMDPHTREAAVAMARSLRRRGVEGEELHERLAVHFGDYAAADAVERTSAPYRPPAPREHVALVTWWQMLGEATQTAIVSVFGLVGIAVLILVLT